MLPLENLSRDENLDYLTDGLTESLINNLSQLPRIKVMARSTVFRYKGREMDPQDIGQDLGVRAVLTGRVLQRDDTLTIGAELVDVVDGSSSGARSSAAGRPTSSPFRRRFRARSPSTCGSG